MITTAEQFTTLDSEKERELKTLATFQIARLLCRQYDARDRALQAGASEEALYNIDTEIYALDNDLSSIQRPDAYGHIARANYAVLELGEPKD